MQTDDITVIIIVCVVMFGVGEIVNRVTNYFESVSAINAGYVQCLEDNRELWKKTCNQGLTYSQGWLTILFHFEQQETMMANFYMVYKQNTVRESGSKPCMTTTDLSMAKEWIAQQQRDDNSLKYDILTVELMV